MKNEFVKWGTHDEIQCALRTVAKALGATSTGYRCLIHSIQPHRKSYFRELDLKFDVRSIVFPSEEGVKGLFTKVILGHAAVIDLKNYDILEPLFLYISRQALAGFYVLENSSTTEKLLAANCKSSELIDAVQSDPTHLSCQIDEDSADSSGKIPIICSVGSMCPQLLRDALTLRD